MQRRRPSAVPIAAVVHVGGASSSSLAASPLIATSCASAPRQYYQNGGQQQQPQQRHAAVGGVGSQQNGDDAGAQPTSGQQHHNHQRQQQQQQYHRRTGTVGGATMNTLCNVMGAGVLALPAAFHEGSIVMSILLLGLIAKMAAVAAHALTVGCDAVGCYSYTECVVMNLIPLQAPPPTTWKEEGVGNGGEKGCDATKKTPSSDAVGESDSVCCKSNTNTNWRQQVFCFFAISRDQQRRLLSLVLELIIVLSSCGTLVVYSRIIGDAVPPVLDEVFGWNHHVGAGGGADPPHHHGASSSSVAMFNFVAAWVVPSVVFFVMSCAQTMEELKWTSLVGFITILYIVGLVVVTFVISVWGCGGRLFAYQQQQQQLHMSHDQLAPQGVAGGGAPPTTTMPMMTTAPAPAQQQQMPFEHGKVAVEAAEGLHLLIENTNHREALLSSTASSPLAAVRWFSMDISGLLGTISTCAMAFGYHFNVPYFYTELRDRRPAAMLKTVANSFPIIVTSYLAVGLLGYLTFGVDVAGILSAPTATASEGEEGEGTVPATTATATRSGGGNIITNFSDSNVFANIGRIGLLIHFAAVYPVISVCARRGLHRCVAIIINDYVRQTRAGALVCSAVLHFFAGGERDTSSFDGGDGDEKREECYGGVAGGLRRRLEIWAPRRVSNVLSGRTSLWALVQHYLCRGGGTSRGDGGVVAPSSSPSSEAAIIVSAAAAAAAVASPHPLPRQGREEVVVGGGGGEAYSYAVDQPSMVPISPPAERCCPFPPPSSSDAQSVPQGVISEATVAPASPQTSPPSFSPPSSFPVVALSPAERERDEGSGGGGGGAVAVVGSPRTNERNDGCEENHDGDGDGRGRCASQEEVRQSPASSPALLAGTPNTTTLVGGDEASGDGTAGDEDGGSDNSNSKWLVALEAFAIVSVCTSIAYSIHGIGEVVEVMGIVFSLPSQVVLPGAVGLAVVHRALLVSQHRHLCEGMSRPPPPPVHGGVGLGVGEAAKKGYAGDDFEATREVVVNVPWYLRHLLAPPPTTAAATDLEAAALPLPPPYFPPHLAPSPVSPLRPRPFSFSFSLYSSSILLLMPSPPFIAVLPSSFASASAVPSSLGPLLAFQRDCALLVVMGTIFFAAGMVNML